MSSNQMITTAAFQSVKLIISLDEDLPGHQRQPMTQTEKAFMSRVITAP